MADDIKKRKRLSGSQYLKKRLAREKDLVKQKGSLLKFCQQNSQENVINDNDTDDSEENSGNKNIEDLSMGEVDNKKKDYDEKYTNFKSLDFNDPNKWPSIDEK